MTGYAAPTFDGSNYFQIPNYGMSTPAATTTPTGLAPPAVNPINSYMASQMAPPASTVTTPTSVTSTVANPVFPTAPVASPGLAGVLGGSTLNPSTSTDTSLGANTGTMGLILGGIQTIGSLWQAWEANKLAKKQFAFSKEFANANLNNSIQSYNTTLGNQAEARAGYEGWSDKKTERYVDKNELSR